MRGKKTTKRSAANNGRTAGGKFAKGNPHAFKPGQSGNPGGRPRDTITPHLREVAQERGRELAEMLFDEAIKSRSVQAASIILDRLDGRSRQGVDLQVDDRRRDVVERAVAGLMAEAGMSREEAVAELRQVAPDIQWEE